MVKNLPNKIVFLDIDGCVTSKDDDTYFNPNPAGYHPSDILVGRIVGLCRELDAKVIISSNWRKFDTDGVWHNSYGTYHNPINKLIKKLGKLYIGNLPKIKHVNKSQALVIWMEETDFNGKFVIFDDDDREQFAETLEYGIKDHYVHVDVQHGITESDIELAKKILRS